MLSNILQQTVFFFRDIFITSLKVYKVKVDPNEIKKETYSKLSQAFKDQLDAHSKIWNDGIEYLNEEKKAWLDMGKDEDLVPRAFEESVKAQAREIEKGIKKINAHTKLYLVGFNENLTTKEVKKKLQQIGFRSAGFLEAILLVQQYEKSLPRPIHILDAYCDADKKIGTINSDFYCVSFCNDTDSGNFGFHSIGEVEDFEFYHPQSGFMAETLFLVKPI